MNYYSTNGNAPIADLQKAVVKGLAEDRGLYMPEEIYKLPKVFFDDISGMKFQDISYCVATNFFGDDGFYAPPRLSDSYEGLVLGEAKVTVTMTIKNATDEQLGDKMPEFTIDDIRQEDVSVT